MINAKIAKNRATEGERNEAAKEWEQLEELISRNAEKGMMSALVYCIRPDHQTKLMALGYHVKRVNSATWAISWGDADGK